MTKLEVKDVGGVFVGVAFALKCAGKLTELDFLVMLERLEIDESVFRSEYESFEAFENFILQTEEKIRS